MTPEFYVKRWLLAALFLATLVYTGAANAGLVIWEWALRTAWETAAVMVAVLLAYLVLWALPYAVFAKPVLWILERRSGTQHGSAQWQGMWSVLRGRLNRSGEIYLGAVTDSVGRVRPLTTDGREHVLICGPTRSGKGLTLIASLLSWRGSAVIYDCKAELHTLTAGWRSRVGDVFRFAPAENGSAVLNFLSSVRIGGEHETADVLNIGTALVEEPASGHAEVHWIETARELIGAVCAFVLHGTPHAGLADVAHALSDPQRPAAKLWEAMMADELPLVAGAARAMADRADREASSIVSTALRALQVFRDPLVAANTSGVSDIDLGELADGARPVSLYIVSRPVDTARLRGLVRLVFELAMARLISAELRFDANGKPLPAHRHRTALVLDELDTLGHLPVLEEGLSKSLGFGVVGIMVIQAVEQLKRRFGPYETLSANAAVKVLLPPTSLETARWISALLGSRTVTTRMRSRHLAHLSVRGSVTTSEQHTGRPLLYPEELSQLPVPRRDAGLIVQPGAALILDAGHKPIMGTQLIYSADPELRRRANLPPDQPRPVTALPAPEPYPLLPLWQAPRTRPLIAAAVACLVIVTGSGMIGVSSYKSGALHADMPVPEVPEFFKDHTPAKDSWGLPNLPWQPGENYAELMRKKCAAVPATAQNAGVCKPWR